MAGPRPPADFVSHDGRFRIRWAVAPDGSFFQARLEDESTGRVLLDLWGGDGFTAAPLRTSGGEIDLAVTGLGVERGNGVVVVDADAGTYLVAAAHGSLRAVTARLDAAGLRWAGAPEPVLRAGPDGAEVSADGRFAVTWVEDSEGHGAIWRHPRVVDTRTGRVLLDLSGDETYGFAGTVVRAAGAVVEVALQNVVGGPSCHLVVDADARTFEIRPLAPAGATYPELRDRLRGLGLAD